MSGNEPPIRPAASFLDRLKQATLPQHRQIERRFRILDPELTLDQYRRWLERLYGFYAPFEALIEAWAPELRFAWTARRKLPLLGDDLAYLGVPPEHLATLPRCSALPDLTDLPRVHGALYVVEGSTLGGQYIAGHLERRLQLRSGAGASFFQPYGEQTLPQWQEFRRHLTAIATTPASEAAIIEAAQATFEALDQWLAASSA